MLSLQWVGGKRSRGHLVETDGKEDKGTMPVEAEVAKASRKEEKERKERGCCTAKLRMEEKSAMHGTTRIRGAGINAAGCMCVRYASDSIQHMHAKEKTRRTLPEEGQRPKRSEEVSPRSISSLRGVKRKHLRRNVSRSRSSTCLQGRLVRHR